MKVCLWAFALLAIGFMSENQAIAMPNPHDSRATQLNTVRNLVFHRGSMTTGRRVSSVQQMVCVGGAACGSGYEPKSINCENIGVDYANGDPDWKCTASLENGLRLGKTDVICEGFRERDDPWILKGSCGLEYQLLGSPVNHGFWSYSDSDSTSHHSWLRWTAGLMFAWYVIRRIGSFFSRQFKSENFYDQSRGSGYASSQTSGGSGTGFWHGLGTGAGLGYLFGKRNNTQRQTHAQRYEEQRYYPQQSTQEVPQARVVHPDEHQSTGYGTTKRREDEHPMSYAQAAQQGQGYPTVTPPPSYANTRRREDEQPSRETREEDQTGYGTTKRRG
jgi:hypothetical protein